jgi:hypothetical protein
MEKVALHKCLHLVWVDTAGQWMQLNALKVVFQTVILPRARFAQPLKMELFAYLKTIEPAIKIKECYAIIHRTLLAA